MPAILRTALIEFLHAVPEDILLCLRTCNAAVLRIHTVIRCCYIRCGLGLKRK